MATETKERSCFYCFHRMSLTRLSPNMDRQKKMLLLS
nr:MAG TPA: hypothetical protein [Caudoviricetes sp.]